MFGRDPPSARCAQDAFVAITGDCDDLLLHGIEREDFDPDVRSTTGSPPDDEQPESSSSPDDDLSPPTPRGCFAQFACEWGSSVVVFPPTEVGCVAKNDNGGRPLCIVQGEAKGAESRVMFRDAWTGEVCGKPLLGHLGGVMKVRAVRGTSSSNAHAHAVECLATCSDDQTLRLWSSGSDHTSRAILSGHSGYVQAMSVLDPSVAGFVGDAQLISGSWDHTAKLWSVATLSCVATMRLPGEVMSSLVVHSQVGGLTKPCVAFTSYDGSLCLFCGAEKIGMFPCGSPGMALALHSTSDGILVGNSKGRVALFDLRDPSKPVSTLQIHQNNVWAIASCGDKDDDVCVSCSDDKTLARWNLSSKTIRRVKLGRNAKALISVPRAEPCPPAPALVVSPREAIEVLLERSFVPVTTLTDPDERTLRVSTRLLQMNCPGQDWGDTCRVSCSLDEIDSFGLIVLLLDATVVFPTLHLLRYYDLISELFRADVEHPLCRVLLTSISELPSSDLVRLALCAASDIRAERGSSPVPEAASSEVPSAPIDLRLPSSPQLRLVLKCLRKHHAEILQSTQDVVALERVGLLKFILVLKNDDISTSIPSSALLPPHRPVTRSNAILVCDDGSETEVLLERLIVSSDFFRLLIVRGAEFQEMSNFLETGKIRIEGLPTSALALYLSWLSPSSGKKYQSSESSGGHATTSFRDLLLAISHAEIYFDAGPLSCGRRALQAFLASCRGEDQQLISDLIANAGLISNLRPSSQAIIREAVLSTIGTESLYDALLEFAVRVAESASAAKTEEPVSVEEETPSTSTSRKRHRPSPTSGGGESDDDSNDLMGQPERKQRKKGGKQP